MENITKISETVAKIVIPQPDLEMDVTLEQLDRDIQGIDESITNFTNQIASLEEKKSLLETRKAEVVKKGIITETEHKAKKEAEKELKEK